MFLPELQWRQWTQEDLALLLVAGLLEQTCPAAQFPLLFMYFDKVRSGGSEQEEEMSVAVCCVNITILLEGTVNWSWREDDNVR